MSVSAQMQSSAIESRVFIPMDMEYNVVKSYAGWKANTKIHISGIEHITEDNTFSNNPIPNEKYYLIDQHDGTKHEVKTRFDGAMEIVPKFTDDIWNHYIIGNVLTLIQKEGFQSKLRKQMEDDALDFIHRLEMDGRSFSDPYLENYIYSLVSKIAPATMIDGRPGNVNIVIINDEDQNAFTFSNGTIVITTSLLATLHSEDELVAILSHEIAHFVLDHSVVNTSAMIKRKESAEFWAGVATVAAAAVDIYAASRNRNYIPGWATWTTYMISSAIAASFLEEQGIHYNHQQEYEADDAAVKVLEFLGYQKDALASALSRLRDTYLEERNTALYFSTYTHPSLNQRIKRLGTPKQYVNSNYEKMVSFAVTAAVERKVAMKRFRQALSLVNQNIDNGVGVADDYINKASCLLAIKNDIESNENALNCIHTAKELSPSSINLYKPEIVALLRLNDKAEATRTLKDYQVALDAVSLDLKNQSSADAWNFWSSYIVKERTWINNMLIKLRGM